MFDLAHTCDQMARQARAIHQLADGIDADQARWRPGAADWSLLEVICHLLDEERSDFRVRLDIILHRPGEPWPPIDPQGWVTSRRYNERDLAETLAAFRDERAASLTWLRGLADPAWDATYPAPWGAMRAGDMLAAWAAHDLLHLRQLVELHWAYANRQLAPYSTRYAGEW